MTCTDAGAQALLHRKDRTVNYGVKLGVHSVMPVNGQITFDGVSVENLRPEYDVGMSVELLMRVNLARFFVQPAVSLNYASTVFGFDRVQPELPVLNEQQEIARTQSLSMEYVSLEAPFVVGFHILKNNPYLLSVMSGANVKYNYDIRFASDHAGISDVRRELPPYDLSLYSALEVTIGKLIFDFGYEYGLNRFSYVMNMDMYGLEHSAPVKVKQRAKSLRMSVGLLF
jgi:hypothetical protein